MAEDKIYTIPLRKEWMKVPVYKRSAKAIRASKQFLLKHLKKEVKIGPYLNEHIWNRGNRSPPGKVKIRVEDEEGKLTAELVNAPRKEVKKDKDTIKIKKPKILQRKEEKGKESKEEKNEKIAREKEKIDKKSIENIPKDKQKEKEEKERVKIVDDKPNSPKKERIIPTEKHGQVRSN